MRWWLNTDNPKIFSVDNSSVSGMDFSALDPTLWMVQWTEGKGEVEFQSATGVNLNGLRESFYDVTPYTGLFQQFLQRLPGLTLDQAKKIQIDLIKQLFESKRQLPYHYPVIAGDYWWDATDGSLYASTAGGLQNTVVTLNAVIDQLNAMMAGVSGGDSGIVAVINQHAVVGNTFISQTNSMIAEIGGNIVNETNYALDAIDGIFGQVNSNVVVAGQTLVPYLNDVIIGYRNYDHLDYNTINNRLRTDNFFGLTSDLPYTSATFSNVPTNSSYRASYLTYLTPGTFNDATSAGLSWTDIEHVPVANSQWIPIGGTVAVNVTPDEQTAILTGIADRTSQLFVIKNQKIGEVNILTTIAAVIAYDVLAGWPIISVPPGYKLEAPTTTIGGGLTIIGTTSGSGDFPEAPSNGVTYGRRNAAWNPALALSGDVLDGGNY